MDTALTSNHDLNISSSSSKKKKKRIDVEIDFVAPREGFSSPFVGYFPSGFDPSNSLQHHQVSSSQDQLPEAGIEIKAYQNSEKYKHRQHQLVATSPQGPVDFVGTNYEGEGAIWQPGHYVLGVFDKESRSLKVVPLAGNKIFRMEPRVRGLDYTYKSTRAATTAIESSTKETMLEKRNLLTATFGTQKSRVRLNRIQRGRVNEEALVVKDDIGQLLKEAGKNAAVLTRDEALKMANATSVRNIPPHDPFATSPEKAFLLDRIITLNEQKSLGDLDLLMAAAIDGSRMKELHQTEQYPAFVLNRLHKLRVEKDEEGNSKNAMMLSYIRHLLAFYHLPHNLIRYIIDPVGFRGDTNDAKAIDLREKLNIPHAVAVKILQLFTTLNQNTEYGGQIFRTETDENTNLLISYILVLGLMIDSFQADPHDLALELKMPISKLKPHYLELGCKVSRVKQKERVGVMDPNTSQKMYKVVLPVPLEFPKIKPKIRRK